MKAENIMLSATLLSAIGIAGCMFDTTPAEIHDKLIPEIANELIKTKTSSRVNGITPQIQNALRKYPSETISFKIGAPGIPSESGIRFYHEGSEKEFLTIGLELLASEKKYRVFRVVDSSISAESALEK